MAIGDYWGGPWMHFLNRAACAAASLLLAFPAHAQNVPPPSDTDDPIIVTGRQLEEQVRAFVRALTPTRYVDTTISRFEKAVCPIVVGLAPAQNEAVAARLRLVADATGLLVSSSGCVPNMMLAVTADKQKFIRTVASRFWGLGFGEMTPLQIRRLARSPGPAAAWQATGLLKADGTPAFGQNRTTEAATRLRPAARWAFVGSYLVVERKALEGLTVTQLADYAAMRLLARTDPSRVAGKAPTILTVLEAPMGSAIPITLTDWDLAFLRGLYSSPQNLFAARQRSEIANEMREDLGERREQD
jgi:hypothetical protein